MLGGAGSNRASVVGSETFSAEETPSVFLALFAFCQRVSARLFDWLHARTGQTLCVVWFLSLVLQV